MKTTFYKALYKLALRIKKFLIPIIPKSTLRYLKQTILHKTFASDLEKLSNKTDQFSDITGINLIGYARAEMGLGESCRIAAKILETTILPFGIINFTGTNTARMSDHTWKHKEINNPRFNINIFHLNAEQMIETYTHFGPQLFEGRYNIGYWHWELPDFPEGWLTGFKFVDEVWVPSSFVADAVSMKSPVPVVRIPHGIAVNIEKPRDRNYYRLPEEAFLFLTMYDVNSFQQRKNPLAAIEAFKAAFGPEDKHVGLVVKVNNANSNRGDLRIIRELTFGYKNIYLIKDILSRSDTNALIQCTDSYISLHRSEGFGLGLAEAMYLGKPAIGTNWSANTDFMNNQNSCLVNYQLIPVGKDHGPYQAYQLWADPDIEHASNFMRKLSSDQDYYKELAYRGQQTIKRDFSPSAVGKMVTKRLKYIQMRVGG